MYQEFDWDVINATVNNALYSGSTKYCMRKARKDLASFGNKYFSDAPHILEIGAGRGEHFSFVKSNFAEYVMTDISPWGKKEYRGNNWQ